MLIYAKAEPISLKSHPDYAETWVRDRLAEDPSLLGLGPLVLRGVERTQTGATQSRSGRLDLLFADPLDLRRYEVELMLGAMDESHVIRAIEYWDAERRHTPQHVHCAVMVAEQISPRFLSVLGLFTPSIPIIALRLTALRINDYLTLQFVHVLGDRRPIQPDIRFDIPVTDRSLAEPQNLAPMLLEECLSILRSINPAILLDHRRDMVAVALGERRSECLSFFPHRDFLGVKARAGNKDSWLSRLEAAGIVVLSGGPSRKRIHFRLTLEQSRVCRELLRELFEACLREQGVI